MSVEQHKAVIRRWIEQAWNTGDVEIADELYSPDYCARGSVAESDRELRGVESVKQMVRRTRGSFPDIHFTIEHLIAEDDKVVGVFTVRGTHQGYLDEIPPTGRQVTFMAVDVWRFEQGRIVERCVISIDRLDLLRQLGVIGSISRD